MIGRLLLVLTAILVMVYAPGCGADARAPVAAKSDTAVQTGAVCDTTLDTTAVAGGAVQPDTQRAGKVEPKPKAESKKVVEQPKELPKMWDFGSEKCIPCKEMLSILTPMMADYQGKVDVRIINVYEDKERTQQFRIVTIPTQVFVDASGKELFRHIGVYPRDSIEARFRQYGFIN
jgi:thioredoxin 1